MASSMTEEEIQCLYDSLPCRRNQVDLLLSLFGKADHLTCPSIFIYGHAGTGKTYTVTKIFKALQVPYVVTNCVECFTGRLQYEHILTQLSAPSESSPHKKLANVRCDNMNDFIRCLKSKLHDFNEKTVYLVFDKADRLRNQEFNLLPCYLRLQELTEENVCVIFLTEILWEKFYTGANLCDPFVLHFPHYTKNELLDILKLDCPPDYTEDLYTTYLNILLGVFYMVCRNLTELRYLAMLNFSKYVEPIQNGEIYEDEHRRLWKNIEPYLRKALQTVYLREVSSVQWEKMIEETEIEHKSQGGLLTQGHLDLPYYSKYLLISSYLASYNPSQTDKRFFAKNSGKISKREKLTKRHERTTNQLLGPKAFPLERLMAIFYSIVEGSVIPSIHIYMQISSLVTLRLLAVVSDDEVESPKYKCLINLDFIRSVARTVGFDIQRYIYDLV